MLKKINQSADFAKSSLLATFFNGEAEANGMIIDRFGRVRQKVHVIMNGYWANDKFKMDEVFTYEDGREELRSWSVEFTDENTFLASSDELKSPAIGFSNREIVKMEYTFPVPIASRMFRLKFDDRMYLLDENTLFEQAKMSKFGIHLAEIVLVFRKKF